MAEKEPKPKTPRARSLTTKKVAQKTATKKTTKRARVVEEDEIVSVVAQEPVVEDARPARPNRRQKGMTFGFLLSSFALLSAASAAAVYVGYTAEGQINVEQRLAEAPANFEEPEQNVDEEDESASNEQALRSIPFGALEMAGDAAVPPPPPQEPATTSEVIDESIATSTEVVTEEAIPEPQVEGVNTTPAPEEAVTPEEASATQ